MRPAILFPLFAEIRTLSGVGPKLEKLIAKVAGPKLVRPDVRPAGGAWWTAPIAPNWRRRKPGASPRWR